MNVAPKVSYHQSHTHAVDTDASVKRDRVKNGLCPTCGAQVSKVKKSLFRGRTYEPLSIPGKVDRGCCLRCNPDNTTVNQNTNNATPSPAAGIPQAASTTQNVPLTPAAVSIPQAPLNERRRVKKTFTDEGFKGEYDGEVDDFGMRNGYGSIRWSNGKSYEGQWRNNQREGQGKHTWANGDVYVGQYRNDKKEGRGKYMYHDGSEFDGDVYEGEFKDDKYEGWGKYTHHKSRNVYEGEWKNDQKEGRGKFTFASTGDVREGQWRNDVKDGPFIYRYKGGDVDDEVWENDKLVSEKKRIPSAF